jgi:hypothetical protein
MADEKKLTSRQPNIGDIVHYVLGVENSMSRKGLSEDRPAIVVRANPDKTLQLVVFTDEGDYLPNSHHAGSVSYDETGKTPRTWHYPE